MRCLRVASSSAVATLAASALTSARLCMTFAALRRACTMRSTRKPIQTRNSRTISTQRLVAEANGS